MKEHWWRSWHGAPTDPKWLAIARMAGVLPGVVIAIAWAVFDHASQAVTRGDASSFDCDAFSAFSGFKEEEIELVIDAMTERGMISKDGILVAWERRQPKREDNSTARTKAWRERNAGEHNVTQCDARGEERREDKDGANAPPTPEKQLFDRGVEVLGPKGRGLIAKLLKSKKGSIPEARSAIEIASLKSNPHEYIGAVIRGPLHERHGKNDPDAGILWRTT